ncbi:MAG: ABC-F family ATP-binding cassette domain-containing protein [Deltaproteobacteria bacterium]|nr:ABC-F family ATP-binding cassette domain-containing protein [Deltaproteobacteria bacterium]
MINIENLQKSFGGQVLFDGLAFKVNARERIGLVGRNGHGKTTLFRIITGEEAYDGGALTIPKNYRMGIVRQRLDFTEDTILTEGMTGLPETEKDHHWKVEKILMGLGFSQGDMQRHPQEFSGGFQVRLNLAKVLVSEPDLLLLDEPTNYLDITSIRWIERFLVRWPHELMLITHDRGFMDKVVTHMVGIHRHKARKIAGDTHKYYSQVAQDEEVYEKTRLNDERRQKEIKQFITRFRAKARLANLVQSRIKTLEKLEKKDKLAQISTLDFAFRSERFRGKHVLSVRNAAFTYNPDVPLINNFDLSVNAGDRICVIGKNGKGKTTLLKLLAGALDPQTGEIQYNPSVKKGFFEQTNIQTLDDRRTVEEEILYSSEGIDQQTARNICGAMMFEGNSALKKISVLSGGEKSRVILGKILVTPLNLLLLDEPTNHLDMDSCDALLAAIDSFEGTVIMVTHNEMFLHALAERLVVFQDDGIALFEGGYSSFLNKHGWDEERTEKKPPAKTPERNESTEKLTKKEARKKRSELIVERGRLLKPLKQQIRRAEDEIEKRENRLKMLNEDMMAASSTNNGKQIAEISKQIHACNAVIEKQFTELETLHDKKGKLEEKYTAIINC